MQSLTVGQLAEHLTHLDPDLPIGVCQLSSTTNVIDIELCGIDGPVIARSTQATGRQPAALWLVTSDLRDNRDLQARRPAEWVLNRTCGCLTSVDINTPGRWPMPPCEAHPPASAHRSG